MIDIIESLGFFNDKLFGFGGVFFFPYHSTLATMILSVACDGGLDYCSSAEFLETNLDELSRAETFIDGLLENGTACFIEEDGVFPSFYSFDEKEDEEHYKKLRLDFLPIKKHLQEWPLPMLVLSALYRCYVAECCPYINVIWNLIYNYKDYHLSSNTIDPKCRKIKTALNANQFDEALLQDYMIWTTKEQVNQLKKVKVSNVAFWGQIFTYIFFAEEQFPLATSILQEFKAFAKRNSYFKTEFPTLAAQLLYKLKYHALFFPLKEGFKKNPWNLILIFLSLQVFILLQLLGMSSEKAQIGICLVVNRAANLLGMLKNREFLNNVQTEPLNLVFLSLQVLSLLQLLGVNSEKAKAGICLTVKENNIDALKSALEEIYGPIYVV